MIWSLNEETAITKVVVRDTKTAEMMITDGIINLDAKRMNLLDPKIINTAAAVAVKPISAGVSAKYANLILSKDRSAEALTLYVFGKKKTQIPPKAKPQNNLFSDERDLHKKDIEIKYI